LRRSLIRLLAALPVVAGLGAGTTSPGTALAAGPGLSQNAKVFASGFNDPRGLHFGPDGRLYVAEGGTGGTRSTDKLCQQVPIAGPYLGGDTGRISQVDEEGSRSTVIDGLPSTQGSITVGGDRSSVADVAWIGRRMYALLAGAGCSHGNPDTPNAVLRVNRDRTTTTIANLSAFIMANLTKNHPLDDFEPDGTWYSMVRVGHTLYATEPNHSEIDAIRPDGSIHRLVDLSTANPDKSWVGPTAMVFHRGALFVGNLAPFPQTPEGAAKIRRVSLDGKVSDVASGLHAVLGVAFDRAGRLYALESFVPPALVPGPDADHKGRVVRLTDSGTWEPVVTGLRFPTAMTFGRDGRLYISNCGYHCGTGIGNVVRATIPGVENGENEGDGGGSQD
jgi:hypothetical protein